MFVGSRASRQDDAGRRGGLDPIGRRPLPQISELRTLRAVVELERQLHDVGDVHRAARLTLRAAIALAPPDEACVATLQPGREEAVQLAASLPDGAIAGALPSKWDLKLLARFARGNKTEPVPGLAMARLKRRARPWAVIALRWHGAEPDWGVRNAITRLAGSATEAIEHIERDRVAEVRSRIDRKVMEQLRPKDLFYQILDGLRSLTGYDHSGMLLASGADGNLLIAAEQLAWRKGKSDRIGALTEPPPQELTQLAPGLVWGFSCDASGCRPWDPAAPPEIGRWLAERLPRTPLNEPAPAEIICATLRAGDAPALLRLAAVHAGTFGPYEAELVRAFVPQAAVAIQNAERAEALRDKVIQAERKNAMAELARGVSHDVNNALGSVIPLVQQMREDVADGRIEPVQFGKDLEHIERSVQVCKRIFGGMLRFAREAGHSEAPGASHVHTAMESVRAIFGDGLRRSGIRLVIDVEPGLEPVPLRQAELEQLLLNLVGNARDAMASLGRGVLVVRASMAGAAPAAGQRAVQIEVIDTGTGIPRQHLAQVFEPFYTTKPRGSGLGLSVCRSIVWQTQGRLHAESPVPAGAVILEPGEEQAGPGSRFVVQLPLACGTPAGGASGGASGGGSGGPPGRGEA